MGLSTRKWCVDTLLNTGLVYQQVINVKDIREAIRDVRNSGTEVKDRPSTPLVAWAMDIAVEDIAMSFPNASIMKMDISEY